ncbi:PREDICTED: la protein homolog [Polistes dominula]|uniref:La protein homolog n=1 Tax=Polistes dominula TaxID=743375 RepID=A0ABM1IFT3_POLDO|nr:PREDICTED: la protein homolog [Polistes dominula]
MDNSKEENNIEKDVESVNEEVKEDKPVENLNDDINKKEENVETEESKETEKEEKNKEEEKTKEVEDKKVEETKEIKESSEPTTELLEQIKDQIEFYFGDVNMQRDKFLTEQIKLENGWIPLTVMLNFNMLATMTTNCDVIVKALESSELIEVSEDKTKIRRSPKFPLPKYDEEYRKAQEARTVYMKGFPLKNTNIQKLKTFFKQYEPYENVVIRKYQDKDKVLHFKGSIFVQFKTLDDAKTFMERKSVKYNDVELIRKWAADYSVERANKHEGRRQHYQEMKEKKNESLQKDAKVLESVNLPKGAIIHLSDMPDKCRRDLIRTCFEKYEVPIAYVQYECGDKEAWIRFQEENAAKTILEKLPNKTIKIDESEITCRVLEDEEEQKYLDEVKKYIVNVRQRNKSRMDNRKGRSTYKGGRKRHMSPPANQPPVKTPAQE